jgi:hypothetical protein
LFQLPTTTSAPVTSPGAKVRFALKVMLMAAPEAGPMVHKATMALAIASVLNFMLMLVVVLLIRLEATFQDTRLRKSEKLQSGPTVSHKEILCLFRA